MDNVIIAQKISHHSYKKKKLRLVISYTKLILRKPTIKMTRFP